MRILIIRLSALGDVVHVLPAVPLLRQRYPACHITWAVEDRSAPLLEGCPGIDRLLVLERRRMGAALRAGNLVRAAELAAAFLRRLRAERFDLVLDFQGLLKSGMIAGFSRSARTIGLSCAREGSRLFYHEIAPAAGFHEHALRRNLILLEHLGIAAEPAFPPLFTSADNRGCAALADGQDRPVVAVHPGTQWPTKTWPWQRVAEVCRGLQAGAGCRVLVTGSADERDLCGRISAAAPGSTSCAGQHTLRELACVLARVDLLVSVDCGPMHLACAAGTPVVALFGPTAPWRSGPFGTGHAVIRRELSCSPCFKRRRCPQGHHRCMRDITVEEVLKVCCSMLPAR